MEEKEPVEMILIDYQPYEIEETDYHFLMRLTEIQQLPELIGDTYLREKGKN